MLIFQRALCQNFLFFCKLLGKKNIAYYFTKVEVAAETGLETVFYRVKHLNMSVFLISLQTFYDNCKNEL